MTRTRKQKPAPASVQLPLGLSSDRAADIYLALLSIVVLMCFFPLLRYFFSQDDFVLMHTAVRDGWNAVTDFFARRPGHFRPLTKGVYFGTMYRLFGLNPTPFHAVSIVLHLVNTVLFYLLMKRVRVPAAGALTATTLYGLSVAFFHVIAWISCVQQLLGQTFMLVSLVRGLDYLRNGKRRDLALSLSAYVFALLSVEQTAGVPVILAAYALLFPGRLRPSQIVDRLSIHFWVFALYLVFIGVWKTAPRDGEYAFVFGGNVLINLATYIGWTLQFGAALPSRMATGQVVWGLPHVVFVLLVAYHLFRRRWRGVVFGLSFFIVAIAPTLLLVDHSFYLHTYIPAFGLLYLIALFAQDVFDTGRLRAGWRQLAMLGCVLVVAGTVSFVMVRKNERYKMFDLLELPRSFVLRRAVIARNVYDSVRRYEPFGEEVEKVYLVYGRESGRDKAAWNRQNVIAATGYGSLINLIYQKPDMPILFKVAGDKIDWEEQYISDIYFFDDFGNAQAMAEPGGD